VHKYMVDNKTVADQKKVQSIQILSRALDRRGLDKRLNEIEEADGDLSAYGTYITGRGQV
jgi:hypothetical protein